MKNVTLLCGLLIWTALAFTACTPNDAFIQDGNVIEERATFEDFKKLDQSPELHTVNFDKEPLSKTPASAKNICTTCDPHIYSISVYNLGGNSRGFGVSGGRKHPCSYEIIWGPGPGYTVDWTSGPFARMTFAGPGTYNVWVNLKSGTGGSSCIVADYVTVTI